MKKTLTGVLTAGFAVASVLTASGAVASPTDGGAGAGHSSSSRGARPAFTPPAYTPPPIDWDAQCANAGLQAAGARCGLLTVPLDYAHPDGEKIKIALSEIKHTEGVAPQGIMLVNPGGPGGSGLTLSRLKDYVPNGGGDPYDWIGFDPRGVGSSQPSLACDPDYFPFDRPDYVPLKSADEQFWLKKSKAYATACDAAGKAAVTSGNLLDYLKTKDTVNDIESIRKAFDQKKINFYGFSYGTTIAQTYATLQPEHVRRFVLDGVTNPARSVYQSNLDQDVAFEKTENVFFAWMAKYNDVYALGNTGAKVRAKWDAILAQTRVAPLDGKVGPDEWTDAFLGAGYYVYGWQDTADAFVAATKGDYGPVEDLYVDANGAPGPGSDNGFAIYLGTQCTDEPWTTSYAKIKADNDRIYQVAPFETWANAWFNGPCRNWTGSARKAKLEISDKGVPGMLLIAETKDAATPFAGALEVRKRFSKSALIEGVNGTTHAGSLSGVGCTDDRIANYLLTGKLPTRVAGDTSDVKCPPVPRPDPTTPDRAQRGHAPAGMPSDLRKIITQAGQ